MAEFELVPWGTFERPLARLTNDHADEVDPGEELRRPSEHGEFTNAKLLISDLLTKAPKMA